MVNTDNNLETLAEFNIDDRGRSYLSSLETPRIDPAEARHELGFMMIVLDIIRDGDYTNQRLMRYFVDTWCDYPWEQAGITNGDLLEALDTSEWEFDHIVLSTPPSADSATE